MRIDLPAGDPAVQGWRRRLEALDRGLRTGDVPAKKYPRLRQEALAELGKALIAPHLEPGEGWTGEHHWVHGHLNLPLSALKETALRAESLYLTDRRLFRWRFQDRTVPEAGELGDWEEILEARRLSEIAGVRRRYAWRWGEAIAGAVILGLALLLWDHLQITGWALALLGAAAVVHALAIPTRWAEIVPRNPREPAWPVQAAGKKSGRRLLALLPRGEDGVASKEG
ncbi:MAG: hypothetical protein ACOYXN_01770 [Acidobacteriota bacterium]